MLTAHALGTRLQRREEDIKHEFLSFREAVRGGPLLPTFVPPTFEGF